MGKVVVANNSSIAAHSGYVGVVAPTTNNAKKRVYLHQVRVSPRGAAIASDVQLYLFDTYTGLSSELLTAPNFVPTFSSTATYTSNFVASADSWADTTADNPTIAFNQTVSAVTGCLKVTDAGGSDAFQIGRAATRVAATHYKVTFQYFAETACGLSFLAMGKTTAVTTNALTRNAGNNHTVVENAWTTCTLYSDAGASTALDIVAVTAKDGATGDAFGGGKYIALKNIQIFPQETASAAAWTGTMADNDDFLWDYRFAELDKIVNNTNAVSSNTILPLPIVGDLYATSYVHVRSATGVTTTLFGTTLDANPAAGTFSQVVPVVTVASNKLVFTPNATLVGTIDTASVKKLEGVNITTPYLKDAILTAVVDPHIIEFSTKQPWSTDGWLLYATSAGASSLLDMSLVYEVV